MAVQSRTISLLVIDGDSGNVRLMREHLHQEAPDQFNIAHSKKLSTALKRFGKEKPDIILLDLNLPDSQGLDIISKLQARVPQLPIVIMVGQGETKRAIKAVGAGAQDYLIKGELTSSLLIRTILSAIERKQVQEKVRVSEWRFRSIFENTTIGMYRTTPEGRILLANPTLIQMLGYESFHELSQRNLEKEGFEPDYPRNSFHDLMEKDGIVKGLESAWEKKDGTTIFVRESAKAFRDEKGNIDYYEGTVEDITERKQADEALRESEEKFRKAFEGASIGKAIASPDGRLLDVNPAICEMYGYSRDEFLTKTWMAITHPDDLSEGEKYVGHLLEGKIPSIKIQQRGLHKDGHTIWIDLNVVLVRDSEDQPLNFIADIVDVTERKKADEALRQSEEKQRLVLDNVEELIYQVVVEDEDLLTARLGFVSNQSEVITGYTPREFIENPELWFSLIHPEDVANVHKETEELFITRRRLHREYRLRHDKSGQYRWLEDRVTPQFDSDGKLVGMFGAARDVTARKETERRYRTLFENVPTGVYRTTVDGTLISANPALVEFFGCESESELLNTNVIEFYADGEDRKRWIADVNQSDELQNVELRFIRKDGQEVIGLDSSRAVRDVKGNIQYLEGTLADITAIKQAEEALANQTKELERLYSASGSLMLRKSLELQPLADTIVNTVISVFDKTNCSLLLVQEQTDTLNRISIAGPYRDQISNKELSLDGKGLVPESIRTGQLINASDVTTVKSYVPNWEQARSELAIPLIVDEKVIGVIDVQSSNYNAFNEEDERLITIFAQQAAITLERARLFEAEKRRALRLNALQNLATHLATLHSEEEVLEALVRQGALLAESPTCSVMLLEGDEARLVAQSGLPVEVTSDFRVPLKLPLIQNAIKSREPIIITDIDRDAPAIREILVRPDINAFFAFPMLTEGQVTGFITLSSLTPKNLSDFELTTYTLLAKLASESLRSARLFEHTKRNMERLASLRTVDMAIAGSFDLSVSLDVLLHQVTDKLQVDAANILIHNPIDHSLKFLQNYGFRTPALQYTNLRIGEGFAGEVAFERRVKYIRDLQNEPDILKQSTLLQDEKFVSYVGIPLIAKGVIKGVLEVFCRKSIEPDQEWYDFLETLAGQAAIAIDSSEMFQELQQSNTELSLAYDNTLEGWAKALELRDEETVGHTRRVTRMTVNLARLVGVKEANIVHIRRGSLLHDIGKMGIPDSILLKSGPLSDEEWVIMREHPAHAFNWLSQIEYLRPALDIPYCHHEKWDGSGYPRGLKGEQIPIAARVFAVVDVWDALLSDRPYRKAWSREQALDYIRDQSGFHFDPEILKVFLKRIVGEE